jgi:magnesium transporter
MEVTTLGLDASGRLTDEAPVWRWADINGTDDAAAILEWGERMGIDPIVLADAVGDSDQPKYDDLGDHLAFTIHAPLMDGDALGSMEVDCILVDGLLVTVHEQPTPGVTWAMARLADRPDWGRGPDVMLASLLDVICRRFVPLVEALDRLADDLALGSLGGRDVVADVTRLRVSEADIRRMLVPLLVALDEAIADEHPLLGVSARRRLRDVHDVVARLLGLLDSARSVLGDALAAYHGMASHRMARATTVFTVYAALMLPLTFITGFFGMNFSDMPGIGSGDGWLVAVAIMVGSLLVSVFVFWRAGLITPERDQPPATTDLLRAAVTAPIRAVGSLAPRRR